MHAYSTPESRVRVYGLLAVIAVVIAWLITWATSHWSWPEWLVSAPSLAGVFTALYALFDRYLWKRPLARKLGLVQIVDVSGRYRGSLISTFNDSEGKPVQRDVVFEIHQTWTHIEVLMVVEGGSSTSRSQSAVAAVANRGEGMHLVYVYRNQVNPAVADSDMGDHEGAADIEVSNAGAISGRYFNSRPRAGTLTAKRDP